MIDFQTAFNVALGIISGLAGWMLNNMYQSLRDLSKADAELASKVSSIEVLVAGQYVKRDEFNSKIDAMFSKLDSIEEKIDRKVSGLRGQ